MTKCNKDEANLKSTVYNQTGENFFKQLSAYNSMSSHLRRVLLAKSVVDARNKSYVHKRRKASKPVDCKPCSFRKGIPNDMIDRLAYDTRHHPTDVIRINLGAKYPCQQEERESYDNCGANCSRSRVFSERTYYEESNRTCCRNGSTTRTNKSTASSSGGRQAKHKSGSAVPNTQRHAKKLKSVDARCTPRNQDFFGERRSVEDLSHCDSISDFTINEANRLSGLSSTQSYEDHEESGQKQEEMVVCQQTGCRKDEDGKYAEFVYEITREIMNNGLYTDEELQDVFKRHVDRNKGLLNMTKMLYEIYQLKISLNITDDCEDDQLEDLIHAQQLLSVTEIRPPTPPKVLDENKVIEKLISYQQVADDRYKSSGGRSKSVVLVDANPELLVTERDVLTSLMEADVDPKLAHRIYKSLSHKSRDIFLTATAQTEAEWKNEENVEDKNIRREENLREPTCVQEKGCITSDLISKEDKDVQV